MTTWWAKVAASPPKLAWGGAGMTPTAAPVAAPLSGRKKKSSWGPTEKTKSQASFSYIQSEDLAQQLEQEETEKFFRSQAAQYGKFASQYGGDARKSDMDAFCTASACAAGTSAASPAALSSAQAGVLTGHTSEVDSTVNDQVLAQMLQYEFDLEHDMNIERTQRNANKNSKLSISYNNYKLLPSFTSEGIDSIVKEDDPIDEIEVGERDEPVIPSCGYVEHNGVLVTKHDSTINSRKNTKKMLNHLPLDVNTGDAGGFTISMSNKVYNQLNESLHSDTRRKQRVHDKMEKGTVSAHMDESTSVTLLGLINSGQLEELGGVISSGKEAIVYHAVGGCIDEDNTWESKPVVVKIFKTRLAEFKTRERYIRDDHRFRDRMTKTNNFTNIKLWVEKEYRNLCRVATAGVASPAPILVRNNLLVMSLIGEPDLPAPQLRNVNLTPANWQRAYDLTIEIVEALVNKGRLVHADLSEYNLLYYRGKVYVIDFAQAVDVAHPRALSYLYRDLCTVANFFRRRGVAGVRTGLELLEDITKLDIRQSALLTNTEQISAHEHEFDLWRGSDCYDDTIYEFLWSASQQRHSAKNREDSFNSLPDQFLHLSLEKTGSDQKEPWVTRKTDASVIGIKSQKKKKRNRKNSKSSDKSPAIDENIAARSPEDEDSSGFCIIDSSDCAEGFVVDPKIIAKKKDDQARRTARVRFNVSDTDAADTEDYNADADTDDFDPDTDTDINVTDHDGDTEGYCGDADDTDNNTSDLNDFKMIPAVKSKGIAASDIDDSSDQQLATLPKSTAMDKRSVKKKNKKSKGKLAGN
ncbi:Protein kinase-like domain [Trinorchestia longiramus]|nr:Protein kinase-like domain [Trinorchestia longiramus]